MARFQSHAAEARSLSAEDRSAIYGMFHLYELAEPAAS
jgi:S-adenosylmethionine:diacylglycerol 3-amino-3-carboxypropyl transferase